MQLRWDDLTAPATGQTVSVTGYPVAPLGQTTAGRFLLTAEPGCCPGCAPRDPGGSVEVEMAAPVAVTAGALRLTGTWSAGAAGYRLAGARVETPPGWTGVTRRRALAAGPLMCLGVASSRAAPGAAAVPAIDLHSHAGGIAGGAWVRGQRSAGPVAEPMRKGGMGAICIAVVSDTPTHHVVGNSIHPYRDPTPGELYTWTSMAFDRLHEMLRAQGLPVITEAADLVPGRPAAIVATEGADFLEGHVERVDEAYRRWSLRHLQLVHYRVNELGDIQTEPRVHGGLTDTGAEVVRTCNRLGIVVDLAHATYETVQRAATITSKPLVLSHTSLTSQPRPFTRQIDVAHARLIAGTGGVIGVWPPSSIYPTLDAMATGIARMVDAVGVDHVGLGSDMRGLLVPSVFPDYDTLPDLATALRNAGFAPDDIGKILGGNYKRVFRSCVG